MFWKKCGAQVKMVLAVMVIALLAGRWNEGAGSGSLSNFWKQGDQKNEDVGEKADAKRPVPNDNYIKIQIGKNKEYVVFCGVRMRLDRLDECIKRLASSSTETRVCLFCTSDSYHGVLIRVLDICHKYKIYNLYILSM